MHFTRVSVASLCLCLFAFATPANAQFFGESIGTASLSDNAVQDNFGGTFHLGNDGGTYLLFQKMVGDGTGYTASYQRLGLRAKLFDAGDSHLWGEGHIIITDESRIGFNVGGGYRWLVDGAVFGVNGWFDQFQTDRNNTYTQGTFGVEMLSQNLDVRANAYFPFGDTENFAGVADPGTVPVFVQRKIAFMGTAFDEQAMTGFDAEAGIPLLQIPWLRGYAGGYFYSSDAGQDAPGARGRIEAAVSNDLSLNFMVSNDRVFDTNYNLGIEYRFSGAISAPTLCPFHGPNRKYAQVRRQWPIATRTAIVPALVDSVNPRTGLPNNVFHVDNTNPLPGDGSYENPSSTLPGTAPDADLILVRTGVGSTVGNITLAPYQRLLGEGKAFTFLDAHRGDVLLPEAFGRTGPAPILVPADPGENLITIASKTEVNNFTLLADNTTAIGGMNVTDFRIEMIGGRAENGIRIVNASGQGIIRNFGMPGTPFDSTDTGVFVSNTSGDPLFLDVDDVHTTGGDVGMQIAAAGGDVVSNIDVFRGDNHADTGLILSAMAGSVHTTDVNDAFVSNSLGTTGRGILLDVSTGGVLAATMDVVGAEGNADLFVADVSNGQLNATIDNAVFNDSVTGNGVRFMLDNAGGRTTFNRLMARRNAIDGLNAAATGAANDYTIEVNDSDLVANTDDAFDTSVSGGAVLRLLVDPTLAIMSATGSGFEFDVRDPGSVLIADLIDTNVSLNTLHAVDGNVIDGGFANVSLLRSLGTDSGNDGLNLNVGTGGTLIGSFVDGSFSRSGQLGSGNGVDIAVADGSSATLSFDNTPAGLNADSGLLFAVTDGMLGPSNLVINVDNGDFSNNPDANVIGSADGAGSQATLNFTNTTASTSATDSGLVLDATNGGIINANWTLGSISTNASDGVRATVDGAGSQIRLDLAGLTIQGNLGDGIDGLLTNGGPGSVLNVGLASTTIDMNAGNGLDLSLTGAGATSRVDIVDTLIYSNFGDGFEFDVLDGAEMVATASGAGTFSSNTGRAWQGTIDGAGSAAALNVNGVNGELSGLEGGRFDVTAGGHFNLTMFDVNVTGNQLDGLLTNVDGMGSRATFNLDTARLRNNGQAGAGDGFEVVATNGALVSANLDNMLVSGNRDNGLRFDVSSGSAILTQIMAPSVEGNGRNGLSFDASMGSVFTTVVTGGSFSNNGASFPASGVVGNATGMGTASSTTFDGTAVDGNTRFGFDLTVDSGASLTTQLNTTGANGTLSASGNTLSGVRFEATNGGPTIGNIVMSGPNEFNNNGLDGVDIDGTNILQMIAGFSGSAMDNGGDGVNIRMDTVAQAAISISGDGGTVSGNAGDGIDITLIDTILTSLPFGGGSLPPMTIDGILIDGNAGHGLVVMATNSNLTNAVISEVLSTNNQGNGVYVALTDSVADNLQIVRNSAGDNVLNGINIELVRTPINNLQVEDNGTLGGVMQNVGLTYFIDGDTFSQPFSISNSSDPGIDLTSFSFDMSTSVAGALYNTVSGASVAFAPAAGSDVTTGLTTVNGTAVPPYPNGLVPDFSQLLALDFNDFNAGESFLWNIDADLTPGGDESVFGNQLIGSSVVVDFSNGVQLTGALMSVSGNPDASIFVATGMTGGAAAVSNNGLNGIRLYADDSDLTNLSMQGNLASNNGESGTLVEAVNGTDVTTATLASNSLEMNGNGGLVLDFTDSSLTDATISDSSLTGNTGNGLLFDFTNSPVSNLVIQDNPDIDQNTLNGISFEMVNSNITGLLVDNNGMGGVVPPPPPASDFDIQLNLAPGLTPSQIAAFQSAETRWESIITGDVPDIGMIDDILIDASAIAIDGPGGILGQAGPTGLRGGSFLPFQGIMQFDTADLATLEMSGQLEDVILHEMAHVLGLGTIWDNLGLLINPAAMGGMDPRFTGAQATAEYNARFANMDPDVPAANTGGLGTLDSHWRESVFTNELMTGFLDPGVNPISRTTIAQFTDIGYVTDISQADPFLVAPPAPSPGLDLEAGFAHNFNETVVDIASAMSSDVSSLHIGNAGYSALVAIQQNGLNGINIELTNSDLTGGVISNNIIAGHAGGDGVRMLNPTTTGTPIELDFTDNNISSNLGGSGVNIAIAQPDLNSTFSGNQISGNGAQGVNLDVSGGATANVDFVGNTISSNASEGVNVTTADTATFNNADFSGNTVGSNGGIGLRVTAADASTVALNLGATGAMNGLNDFDGNGDAGLGVEVGGTSVSTLSVTQSTFTGTTDGALADFNGDGLKVRMLDSSVLTAVIDGDPLSPPMLGDLGAPGSSTVSMSGNAGDGISFYVDGSSNLTSLDIVNSILSGNAGNGLGVVREGMGDVDMVAVANNDITFNSSNGVFLNARNAFLVDDFVITQNQISSNTGNGVRMLAEADGRILADISFNAITSNLGTGILAEERKNDPTDLAAVDGVWVGNTISLNSGYGINLLADHGTATALEIGQDGVDGDGRSLGNMINSNALDGIQIHEPELLSSGIPAELRTGNVSIVNNMITGNGTADVLNENNGIDFNTPGLLQTAVVNNNTITGNLGNGIQVSNNGQKIQTYGPGTTVLDITADNNMVVGNGDAGITISTGGTDAGIDGRQRTDVVITNSDFSMNGGRGMEVLNRGDGDAFNRARVVVDNSTFNLNVLEAVYVVNTADVAQQVNTPPITGGGNLLNNPILDFSLTNSTLTNNGTGSSLSGTGLLMLVGTSGATTSFTDPGGFVSNGVGGLTGRGGVLGTVADNTFGGNFGVDVLFESYVSTVDPASGGTWDGVDFTPAVYESDPLARFDVTFTGNTGDATDVTRLGAFYDTADPMFKSRDMGQPGPGPFTSGSRRRNAQRLAFRGVNAFGDFSAPLISPDGGVFLYPGVSDMSTFRAAAGSTTAGFALGDSFFSSVPFPSAIFGELPFGWGSF